MLVYRTMGALILVNLVLVIWLTVLYFRRRPALPPCFLWGIRLGFALFLLNAVSGAVMVAAVSHGVGAAGDLRHAHSIATHSLQAMPLAGFLAHRLHGRAVVRHPLRWTVAAACALFGLHAWALLSALTGRALF